MGHHNLPAGHEPAGRRYPQAVLCHDIVALPTYAYSFTG